MSLLRVFPLPFLCIILLPLAHAEVYTSDICVYGSTSGGVVAAVQAARLGKSVQLADPGRHLGGMTASGLGWVDFGMKQAIGGMSMEFINRIISHYPNLPASEWKQGKGWTFEPHVAEAVFNEMISEARVPIHFAEELVSVKKDGAAITEITMANGDIFHAKVFIDATYEGDLMARAKVSYTTERESNAQYHETVNGIRNDPRADLSRKLAIDPYIKPGDPSSGLIALVQPDPIGQEGTAGPQGALQAYNYRICLTKDPANRLPLDSPPDYDPARYELVARVIASAQAKNIPYVLVEDDKNTPVRFIRISPMPRGKTDVNSNGWISTDYVGYNTGYPEADYARRRQIAKDHENYLRGYLHFLATDPRVPENMRQEMQQWGLCRDEFTDNGGWPFQMYVRESRRLIGAYVMTEHDCKRQTSITDSIGEGSYALDSHYLRRLVDHGIVVGEGTFFDRIKEPYPIPYRAITPKAEECTNLLVPACCSASHAAYASLRMEPVFMILGQSAATAATLAIDEGQPVQKIDIKRLQERLKANKQIL